MGAEGLVDLPAVEEDDAVLLPISRQDPLQPVEAVIQLPQRRILSKVRGENTHKCAYLNVAAEELLVALQLVLHIPVH